MTGAAPASPPASPAPSARRSKRGLALVIGLALALLLLQQLLLSLCLVRGPSMQPALQEGERVLVWRHPGRLTRGDVVVIRNPDDPAELLIKRVIAQAGERVGVHEGKLVVSGFLIVEPWLKPGTAMAPQAEVTLGPGQLWLLGDNRAESIDSRQLGPFDARLLVGVVVCKIWPPGEMGR